MGYAVFAATARREMEGIRISESQTPNPNPCENRAMPPRYAYWTILIDSKPTAFRAREKEELLPTFHQLRRTSKDVVMKWFARGRLWETPEEASAAQRKKVVPERRGHQWRPGGAHKDPRERFKKGAKVAVARVFRAPHKPSGVAQVLRPAHKPRERRPWTNKPLSGTGASQPRGDAPRQPPFTPERRESEAPSRPADDSRPEPPPRPEGPDKKQEPPERG
jgi:hypothetical protein